MTNSSKKFNNSNLKYQAPLRAVLIVPFVLQIFAAVSLVGYLSFKNGQQAIDKLAHKLQHEVANRVDQHLDTYLALPHQINEINRDAVEQGVIDLKDIKSSGRYFWKQAQVFKQFSFVGYALADNTGAGAGRWLEGQDIVISQHQSGSLKDYTYSADNLGNQTKLVHETEYDATTDVWYLVMATLLGIHTSHWITQPILALNQASKAIAEGNLEQQVANSRIQELNSVAQSFNYMAGQLQTSFAALCQVTENIGKYG